MNPHHTSHIDTNKRNRLADLNINSNILNHKNIKKLKNTSNLNHPTRYFLHQKTHEHQSPQRYRKRH